MPTPDDTSFPTFSKFMDSLTGARHEDLASRPGARVADEGAFSAMREHILGLYEGVEVAHSFVDENGQIFDCVPLEQQPSLKGTGAGPAQPPDAPSPPPAAARAGAEELQVHQQLRPDRVDKFGHSMWCPPGTVPMRRITLDEMTKKENLRDFFRKVPVGAGRHPRLTEGDVAPGVHKYAHAFQTADNVGGHSFLNVWDPTVGSQVFSLSQHWYAGGSPVQTAECGWQVYSGKYGTTQPVLFIYWTADGYQNTGCYNLDCSAFVQTNRNWAFGGTLAPVSVDGGQQYEIEMSWYLSGGNWWLYLGGITAANGVGYYPASLYSTGALANHATDVDYGGEAVDQTAWPPMGSGAFASAGWQHAAYHRDVYYYGTAGGSTYASLTGVQDSSNCYTVDVESTSPPWNEYFYFGGPGGTDCT